VNSIYQSPANDLESKIFDRLDDATVGTHAAEATEFFDLVSNTNTHAARIR
jgi:hypothetical protein